MPRNGSTALIVALSSCVENQTGIRLPVSGKSSKKSTSGAIMVTASKWVATETEPTQGQSARDSDDSAMQQGTNKIVRTCAAHLSMKLS